MKKIVLFLLLCLVMTSVVVAADKPSEESLIRAWEQVQKNNPATVTFDKIADRRYKFKTTLFPFDGELKINDTTIDVGTTMGPYSNFIMAVLDIELVGLPQDIMQRNRKYSIWARSNMHYYDKKADKWLTFEEFQAEVAKSANASSSSGLFSNYILLAALILALVYVLNFLRKNRQDVKTSLDRQADSIAKVNESIEMSKKFYQLSEKSFQMSEKSIQLSEETNKLLNEILAALKKS
jgi:hypothetical protein